MELSHNTQEYYADCIHEQIAECRQYAKEFQEDSFSLVLEYLVGACGRPYDKEDILAILWLM